MTNAQLVLFALASYSIAGLLSLLIYQDKIAKLEWTLLRSWSLNRRPMLVAMAAILGAIVFGLAAFLVTRAQRNQPADVVASAPRVETPPVTPQAPTDRAANTTASPGNQSPPARPRDPSTMPQPTKSTTMVRFRWNPEASLTSDLIGGYGVRVLTFTSQSADAIGMPRVFLISFRRWDSKSRQFVDSPLMGDPPGGYGVISTSELKVESGRHTIFIGEDVSVYIPFNVARSLNLTAVVGGTNAIWQLTLRFEDYLGKQEIHRLCVALGGAWFKPQPCPQ